MQMTEVQARDPRLLAALDLLNLDLSCNQVILLDQIKKEFTSLTGHINRMNAILAALEGRGLVEVIAVEGKYHSFQMRLTRQGRRAKQILKLRDQ